MQVHTEPSSPSLEWDWDRVPERIVVLISNANVYWLFAPVRGPQIEVRLKNVRPTTTVGMFARHGILAGYDMPVGNQEVAASRLPHKARGAAEPACRETTEGWRL
jgi:hypothetical protein